MLKPLESHDFKKSLRYEVQPFLYGSSKRERLGQCRKARKLSSAPDLEINIFMSEKRAKEILQTKFDKERVAAILDHFNMMLEKFVGGDNEGVLVKAGKFVEAVTKALMIYGAKTLPPPRKFKAGVELRALEQLPSPKYSDAIRFAIPKACLYVYEIASNRGGRHDSSEIDANQMDARAVMPILSWVLAEMVRYSSETADTNEAMSVIDELTEKKYPYFEQIDGRTYVNLKGASAPNVALLLLYEAYPKRVGRSELIAAIKRHGHKSKAAEMAISRASNDTDEVDGGLKLRGSGREKAEAILKKLLPKK
jgi:hypothetical protein